MKKYRLKSFIKGKIILRIYPDGIKIATFGGDLKYIIADFVNDLAEYNGQSLRYWTIYAFDHTKEFSNEDIIRITEEGKETWPIELGLVEEIPEEPKRVYMDRYEALRMVYEHGKEVAYDSEEWLETYEYIAYDKGYRPGLDIKKGFLANALHKLYSKKRWYVVEED